MKIFYTKNRFLVLLLLTEAAAIAAFEALLKLGLWPFPGP